VSLTECPSLSGQQPFRLWFLEGVLFVSATVVVVDESGKLVETVLVERAREIL